MLECSLLKEHCHFSQYSATLSYRYFTSFNAEVHYYDFRINYFRLSEIHIFYVIRFRDTLHRIALLQHSSSVHFDKNRMILVMKSTLKVQEERVIRIGLHIPSVIRFAFYIFNWRGSHQRFGFHLRAQAYYQIKIYDKVRTDTAAVSLNFSIGIDDG